MSSNGAVDRSEGEMELRRGVARRRMQVVVQGLVLWVVLFAVAGDLGWVWAWAYVGVGVLVLTVNLLVLPPEVVAERGRSGKENVAQWDKVLAPAAGILALVIPVVAALEHRYQWPPDMSPLAQVAGLVFLAAGQGLFTWGMVSNKFFSTLARLQADRDHAVASAGPYRYVRHPGYVGYITSQLATAVALGSVWGMIPAGLGAVLVVVRTALEDRMLQRELVGYAEYSQRVRYRLLPGVW